MKSYDASLELNSDKHLNGVNRIRLSQTTFHFTLFKLSKLSPAINYLMCKSNFNSKFVMSVVYYSL